MGLLKVFQAVTELISPGENKIDVIGTVRNVRVRQEQILRGRMPPKLHQVVTCLLEINKPNPLSMDFATLEYRGSYLRGVPHDGESLKIVGHLTEHNTISGRLVVSVRTGEAFAALKDAYPSHNSSKSQTFEGMITQVQYRIEMIPQQMMPPMQVHVVTLRVQVEEPQNETEKAITVEYRGPHLRGLPRQGESIKVEGRFTEHNVILPNSIVSKVTGEIFGVLDHVD